MASIIALTADVLTIPLILGAIASGFMHNAPLSSRAGTALVLVALTAGVVERVLTLAHGKPALSDFPFWVLLHFGLLLMFFGYRTVRRRRMGKAPKPDKVATLRFKESRL